jgi:DNA-binding transcriptional MerR regulator
MTLEDRSGDGSGDGSGKAPDAFRTIREVSEQLGVPQHVLRFWETRFRELRPLKRGGNRRYYRPEDVALALTLKRLLHEQGYTVKGAQRLLAERGVRATVAAVTGHGAGRAGADAPPGPAAGPTAGPDAGPDAGALPAAEAARRLRAIRDRLAAALAA